MNEIGQVYRHYKHQDEYKIIAFAKNSETLEEEVVYQALYKSKKFGDNAIWVRPKKMFFEDVTLEDGSKVKRFTPVSETA